MEFNMENEEEQHHLVNGEAKKRKRKRRYENTASPGFSLEDFGFTIESGDPDDKSTSNDEPAPKYREVDVNTPFGLDQFSDEMLFEIFKHLDSWTLMALMNCCDRFHTLVLDHRFWTHIDLSKEPLPLGILEDVLERSNVNTRCIKMRGPSPSQHVEGEIQQLNKTLVETFVSRCTKLCILELQGVTVDFRLIRIVDFPKTLKRLIFNDCNVRMPECVKSIFSGIDTHLTVLEELGIEYSDWFDSYYIMIFSKVPALRWLSLKGCQQLPEFVPYGSMAARFGFKQLEFLDMRFTPITDSDLQCFNAVVTLREILLECPQNMRPDDADETQAAESGFSENAESAVNLTRRSTAPPSVAIDVEAPSTSAASSATSRLNVTISLSPPCGSGGSSISGVGGSASFAVQQPQQNSSSGSSISYSSSSSSTSMSPSLASSSSSTSSNSSSPPPPTVSPAPPPSSPPYAAARGAPLFVAAAAAAASAAQQAVVAAPPPIIAAMPNLGGNLPPHSRFLPRPDQIIYLDLHNRRRPIIMHGPPRRPPNNFVNHIDQVLNHPLFWDMINPLARDNMALHVVSNNGGAGGAVDMEGAGGGPANAVGLPGLPGVRRPRCLFYNRQHNRNRHPITDRGICCFGRPQNPVEQGVIWIRIGNRPNENRFERLIVRNYRQVTDISLQHLVQCSPHLVYLDLSGTGVTRTGVKRFRESKPECHVIATHLKSESDGEDNVVEETVN